MRSGARCWIACDGPAGKMPSMRAFGILLLLLSSGCNNMQVSYATATTPSGATIVSTSGGAVHVQGGVPALLILGAAVLATAADSGASSSSSFMTVTDPGGRQIAPAMLLDRLVAEQDCTKPIEDWSANLKCR